MFRLLIAASGSKANATLVELDGRRILIDCGLTYKALSSATDISKIDAVFITHSHSDHVKGLAVLRKHIDVPFYSAVDIEGCTQMTEDNKVSGMTVKSFKCCHDVPCVGYRIEAEGRAVAVATDTGCVCPDTLAGLEGADTVMLECNHDIDMLRYGPYHPQLKQRIMSDNGHLSNPDCASVLCYLCNSGTSRAVLAHLSETNNTPLCAKKTVREALEKYGFCDKLDVVVANAGIEVEI